MSPTHDEPKENTADVSEAATAAEPVPSPGSAASAEPGTPGGDEAEGIDVAPLPVSTASTESGTSDKSEAAKAEPVPPPAPTAAKRSGGGGFGLLRRFFWMDEQMATAIRDGFGPGQAGWEDYELGRAALDTSEQLSESEELKGARLLLTRAAVVLFGRATLGRAGEEVTPSAVSEGSAARPDIELGRDAVRAAERLYGAEGAEHASQLLHHMAAELFARSGAAGFPSLDDAQWERLTKLPGVSDKLGKLSDVERARVAEALGVNGSSHLATLSSDERAATERSLVVIARELGTPLIRTAGRRARVIIARWVRIGLPVVLALGFALYFGLREEQIEGPNLALHRPVTMSSLYSAANVGHDPSRVVDGDTTGFGFHTDRGKPQHITIDLGGVHPLRRVVVYNRTDCCGEKAVPLRIEVSEDGKKYRKVASRKRTFDVWRAPLSEVNARYVKLVSTSGEYFHLAEVEVY